MLKSTILLVVAFIACANGLKISPASCGRRPLAPAEDPETFIVNGTVSIAGDWPWSVSLYSKPFIGSGSHFCGGVLIRKQWVLSAAHCFSSNNTVQVKIIHDRSNPEPWSRTIDTEVIFRHPDYNSNTITNDVALLRLKEPFEYNDYTIPACIAESPDEFDSSATTFQDMLVNRPGFLTGWGRNRYGGTVQRYLNEVRLDSNTAAECYSQYGSDLYNHMAEICAGNRQSLQGACQGDSGGPYVFKSPIDGRWFNFGLTSWGYSCGIGTVFTRVTTYTDWIKEKMSLYPDEDDEDQ